MKDPNEWNKKIIDEFRVNGGKVGGVFKDSTLLLLHTIGAKSGKHRINPVVTIPDGDRQVIIASKGGAPTHPDWYHNLVANPEVMVELGREVFKARALVAREPERSDLYQRMSDNFPAFDDYKQKTSRTIPVITLSRLT